MNEKIVELMEEYGFTDLDRENAINFVAALLEIRADETKRDVPGSYNKIRDMNSAITEVNELLWIEE